MRRRAGIGLAAAAVAVALAACSGPAMPVPPVTPSASPTPSLAPPTPTPTPTPTVELAVAPLTGEQVPAAKLAHPSLAAKIDDHVGARPQVGLSHTDLVYEELVEGGLTRYVAVWHSDIPKEIGPIRSIRPMDPDIISPLGGIVAYSGGQQRFVALMRKTNVYNAVHGMAILNDVMYRTRDKAAPHNVIVRARTLVNRHLDLAPPQPQFYYGPNIKWSSAARKGEARSRLDLRFSAATQQRWTWDGGARVWRRWQGGAKDRDTSGAWLSAVNVVVVRVKVSTGLGVPKTELIGTGEAWIATGGRVVHATWSKAKRTAPIRFVDDDGVAIWLAPGNTWVELVPSSGAVKFTR